MTSQNAFASSSSTPSSSSSLPRFKTLRRLKQQLSVAGRSKPNSPAISSSASTVTARTDGDPYLHLDAWPEDDAGPSGLQVREEGMSDGERRRVEEGYEWELETQGDMSDAGDQYSWVDPSIIGTDRLGATVGRLIPSQFAVLTSSHPALLSMILHLCQT